MYQFFTLRLLLVVGVLIVPAMCPALAEVVTSTTSPLVYTVATPNPASSLKPDAESATQKGASVSAPTAETRVAQRKVVIDIPSRTLMVMDGNNVLKKFPVGVGRPGFMTPLGKHKVIRKIENPGWENPYRSAGAVRIRPSQNNPLGTRWIGFKADPRGEYGIHGTDSPQSVGKLSSHGCVRMRVPDAEQVFKLVDIGTPVEVTYQVVQLSQAPNGDIWLTRYPDWFKRGVPTAQQVKQQIVQRFGAAAVVREEALNAALATPAERAVSVGSVSTDNKSTVSALTE